MSSNHLKGTAILEDAYHGVQAGDVENTLYNLKLSLLDYRTELGPEPWSDFARRHFATHPFREVVHQSPFSWRSYTQPRGYAGDAVTLDYIYGDLHPKEISELGKRIYAWELATPSCESVRGRRDTLARYIDETVESVDGAASILAIACGHLRELKLTNTWRQGRINNFTALDQDAESLAIVKESFGNRGVQAVSGSVRSLITGKQSYKNQDFVYAAGLYDYLQLPVAQRLTAVMFGMLKPGGRLLVANFHPSLIDIASMETTMNWWLIYRDESEMADLSAEIDPSQIARTKIFRDDGGNLAYLELTRG